MAFINSHKNFAVKSELDVFSTKPSQHSIESGLFIECRPISVLDSDSPLEFFISASDDYIDLPHTQIKLKVKIGREDGADIDDSDSVAPCNNFLNSLFDHVSVELNGKTITPPSNYYKYRTYIENLINYSTEAQNNAPVFLQPRTRNIVITGNIIQCASFFQPAFLINDQWYKNAQRSFQEITKPKSLNPNAADKWLFEPLNGVAHKGIYSEIDISSYVKSLNEPLILSHLPFLYNG
ncbi:CLUMA_CG002778, isoform A [Clunio marinus]|uniref:CLUMA_CG002778, isoform A n=1 Tax=Clunio marinus TaxID=568069 RepID=A0A1J1HMP4_9DIPT|nr:CLUMA_CG002778, isoform A [Clunio marinus]